MSLAIVQSTSNCGNTTSAPNATFGSTPTSGNMLVCQYGLLPSPLIQPNTAAGWVILGAFWEPAVPAYMITMYRYAHSSESTAQTVDNASTNDAWTVNLYEISGVTGTPSLDIANLFQSRPTDYPGTSASPASWNTSWNNELVLLGQGGGNASGSITLSISGGTWTLDQGPTRGTNQGYQQVAYAWHSSVSTAGTAIAPTLTSTAGNRFYISQLGLSSSIPSTGPQVVQTALHGSPTSGTDQMTVVFNKAPTHGNLLVASAYFRDADGAPAAATGWSLGTTALHTSGFYVQVYYKYAGVSESTTQTPDSNTSRNTYDIVCWEVSGIGGTWASSDFVSSTQYIQTSVSSYTPTGIASTANANELVLHHSSSSSNIQSTTHLDGVALGAYLGSGTGYNHYAEARSHIVPSSGTAIGNTLISTQGSGAGDMFGAFIELVDGNSPSTETGTVDMALTKVSFAAGSERAESGAVTFALHGVAFIGAGAVAKSAQVNMALYGVTVAAGSVDLNALPKTFIITPFG